jgi:RNA polymerase sigma factor (sigma-70 family)
MASDTDYEALIPAALEGSLEPTETIIAAIQDRVYNLALRFLWHPQDAEDAAQEILLKVVTRLGQFEFRSAFETWVHRIALNYLIKAKQSRLERTHISFESVSRELRSIPAPAELQRAEAERARETLQEVKEGCTHAMLACLDRPARAAFLLGDVFAMKSTDAAYVLEIDPRTYRQRLSRARAKLEAFLTSHCGLMDPANACRCATRASGAGASRSLRHYLEYARAVGYAGPADPETAEAYAQHRDRIERMAAIYRSSREARAPKRLLLGIRGVLQRALAD